MGESYSDRAATAAGDAGAAAPPRALRVYCAGERPDVLALVRETLRSFLAGIDVETGLDALPAGRVPEADCVVLDVPPGAPGLEAARTLRMAGYEGGIVLLGAGADGATGVESRAAARTSGPVSVRLAAIGVSRVVPHDAIAGELAFAVTGAVVSSDDPALEAARRELRAAQRLNAIGDLAATVQHAANNPLTALMAEAQLLELEPLRMEHREAVQRIIDLARRLAVIIRKLDLPRAR